MTDETKNHFFAPWTVKHHVHACWEVDFEVSTTNGMIVAVSPTEEHANRLVRLPELYDALMETVYYKCFDCMGGLRHNIDLTREELVKNGCPKQNKSNVCIYVKHIELLRKAR